MKNVLLNAKSLVLASLLSLTIIATTACTLTVDPLNPYNYVTGDGLGELYVRWTIDSSTSSSYCQSLDISSWRVDISGPSPDSHTFDCYSQTWDSGSNFYSIYVGSYTVDLYAISSAGTQRLNTSNTAYVSDTSSYEDIHFALISSDFSH